MLKVNFLRQVVILGAALVCINGCSSGNTLRVRVGEEFRITLDSNPTTGYRWSLAQPIDKKILNLVSTEYIAPETDRVGAGGHEIWIFRAIGRGSGTIALKYIRPWEKAEVPERRKYFKVVIR